MTDRVFFTSIGGKQVFCILSTPDVPRGAPVIMSHGFKGTSVGPARQFVDFSRLLVNHGFAVLRFDQPHSGNSPGAFIALSFREWIDTIAALTRHYQAAGYTVCLMGQSMGATASLVAAAQPDLLGTIPGVLLWVPDPATDFTDDPAAVYIEEGQQFRGQFWEEAKRADFFAALDRYQGIIDVVYGERDPFIAEEQRERVMAAVREKGGSALMLPGQGHSAWDFAVSQAVYERQCAVLERTCPHPPL